jgi:MoaA/NifB/PqqE/SkfB family radical SAM enzyme
MAEQSRSRLKKTNLAAFENFLMAKFERLAGFSKTRSYPYVMILDPSSVCQLRCPLCLTGIVNEYGKHKHLPDAARPPVRLARGVVDSIFDECGEVLFYCHFFNWGEPLLNEGLPDYIRAASARNIYTKVDTNLSLRLTDKKLEDLLSAGVGEIAASIDGFSQETYEQYRVGGRFELALDNLVRLAATRDRLGLDTKITWHFLMFKFNEHEVPDIIAFCKQYGIEFLARDPVVWGDKTDWRPAHQREGRPNPYRPDRIAELQSPEWITPAGLLPLHVGRPEGRSCAWHYSYTSVNADGGVLPCCGLYKKTADFGTITQAPGSFGKTWNNTHFQKVRRTFPDGPAGTSEGPTAVCATCTRSESYRDHYTLFDREIIRKYWSLPEDSEARQLDEFYLLLQRSPSAFTAAYAERYPAAAIPEAVA